MNHKNTSYFFSLPQGSRLAIGENFKFPSKRGEYIFFVLLAIILKYTKSDHVSISIVQPESKHHRCSLCYVKLFLIFLPFFTSIFYSIFHNLYSNHSDISQAWIKYINVSLKFFKGRMIYLQENLNILSKFAWYNSCLTFTFARSILSFLQNFDVRFLELWENILVMDLSTFCIFLCGGCFPF